MVGKNIAIATIFITIIVFMALAFRPGSINTVGQGGGYSMGGGNEGGTWSNNNWGGGEHDDDD